MLGGLIKGLEGRFETWGRLIPSQEDRFEAYRAKLRSWRANLRIGRAD